MSQDPHDHSGRSGTDHTWSGNLKLTSSAFSDGGEIPREYGYKNGNQKPPLRIHVTTYQEGGTGIDSLALIMDDPDAMGAVGKVWVHWVAWNIDPTNTELENLTTVGMTDFGEVGYGGPAPPDKRHTYVFTLYALDSELDGLEKTSTIADVLDAIAGDDDGGSDRLIERTRLKGTYAP